MKEKLRTISSGGRWQEGGSGIKSFWLIPCIAHPCPPCCSISHWAAPPGLLTLPTLLPPPQQGLGHSRQGPLCSQAEMPGNEGLFQKPNCQLPIAAHPNPCHSPPFPFYLYPSVPGDIKQSHDVFLMQSGIFLLWICTRPVIESQHGHTASLADNGLPAHVHWTAGVRGWVLLSFLQIRSTDSQGMCPGVSGCQG